MTDDLVAELRQAEWNENPHTNVSLCAEAADEIERLRELHRDLTERLFILESGIKNLYEQAVRGE